MSAMERLLKTVLNVSGVDIEEVKREVTTRIAAFEKNVEVLNNTLISQHQRLANLEANIERLFAHFQVTYIKSDAPAPVATSAQAAPPPPPPPAANAEGINTPALPVQQ